jgi:hypothetical protein
VQGARHRRGSGVGGLARRTHRRDDHTETLVVGTDTNLRQSLPQHRQQSGVFAEYVGLGHRRAGPVDHRRNVDAGVKGIGQQERNYDGVTAKIRQHIAQAWGGPLEERRADVEPRPQPTDTAGDRVRDRRRAGVDAPVGRKNERHDACSPHSVFVRPAHRPLRGSAPSTGFAVQGAHPMDG